MGWHGWNSEARRWRLTALLGIGVAALALVLMLSTFPGDDDPADGEGTGGPGVSRAELGWGFTHTHNSADEGEPQAVDRARRLLTGRELPQIQHIMGWGADNPEPEPGKFNFGTLDQRVKFARSTGGTPVITLCCAPDWMKGGEPGEERTDWSQDGLETAPQRAHYKDFAKLAATVARRYPDVRHYVVWNEFKGFWSADKGRWNQEGYTELYNEVYKALKEVDKDILVGGPYLVMDSFSPSDTDQEDNFAPDLEGAWGAVDRRVLDAFRYWNKNKAGADFVVVDGSSYTVNDELVPGEFQATDKLTAISRWTRREAPDLPLWWAEYYVEPGDDEGSRTALPEPQRVAVQATGMIALARGGTTTAFYWNPQKKGEACAGCLWRSTQLPDGGTKLPMLDLVTRFQREFPPGTRYEKVDVAPDDVPNVRVLADRDAVVVVNIVDRKISAKVDGKRFSMDGYEVRWLKR